MIGSNNVLLTLSTKRVLQRNGIIGRGCIATSNVNATTTKMTTIPNRNLSIIMKNESLLTNRNVNNNNNNNNKSTGISSSSPKRYLSSDDYRKIGGTEPRPGSGPELMNQHGSQFMIVSIPLVIVTIYFVLFPGDKEKIEDDIRERYENEIGGLGSNNATNAAKRDKDFELFYKHTIKGIGNTNTIQDEKERKEVIEMEQRLTSVLHGGKKEVKIVQKLDDDDHDPTGESTAVLAKTAMINDGKSRNPYGKAIKKPRKKEKAAAAPAAVVSTEPSSSTSNSGGGSITGPITVGVIATATIALALLSSGSGSSRR